MKKIWLNKSSNTTCILFFNGWGMDENAVKHLNTEGYDVCMFNDYSTLNGIGEDFENYSSIVLVAWSLGVFAASQILAGNAISFAKSIAINGTLNPVNEQFGIPPEIFVNTLNTWNERNRTKFNLRVAGGMQAYKSLESVFPARTVENQQDELRFIYQETLNRDLSVFQFDTAIIGTGDLIFSPENQQNYWKGKSKIIEMNIPHFPFAAFGSWKEIINLQ
jgi:pimeloyl-[acyl-carrier protein] methyl ester esterase